MKRSLRIAAGSAIALSLVGATVLTNTAQAQSKASVFVDLQNLQPASLTTSTHEPPAL